MTRTLQTLRRDPERGEATSALVFLHGYGADAQDLFGLAEPLAPHLPGTLFLSVNAPEPCRAAPYGRQWFPIPWLDGSSEGEARAGLLAAAADLQAWIDATLEEEGLAPGRLALFGFSQGAMMALHCAPRRAEPLAAVVACSGRLLAPDLLATETVSRPPVLLLHGDRDEMVPPAAMPEAARALQSAGWTEIYAHTMKGTAHGIAPDGLGVALAFLRERLAA
jgi:phospholipase/carboxylesterase